MCGRFALKAPPSQLITHFGLAECADFSARFNIPPGTDIPVIRQSPEGNRVLHFLRWGLVPHWKKDPSKGNRPNNARSESINDRPYFKSAFSQRRCLIPASGFFEWRAEGKIKQPYYISLKSGEPMTMAGLWESWKAPDGNILRTTCIITTGPNSVMAPIHDRMPVILTPDQWGKWLSGPVESITDMMAPYAGTDMQAWPVSRSVSKTVDDNPSLIEPLEP